MALLEATLLLSHPKNCRKSAARFVTDGAAFKGKDAEFLRE